MKRYLLILGFLFPLYIYAQGISTQKDSMMKIPEGIGRHLSELLINRGDIRESPVAVNVSKSLPDEDLSTYKDSPAEFILVIMQEYQLGLTMSWDKLLSEADRLRIDRDTEYLKTLFCQKLRGQYRCAVVLKKLSEYYALTFNTIDWNGDYVMSISGELKAFSNIDSLKNDYIRNLFEIEDGSDWKTGGEAYPYHSNVSIEIENTVIPSLTPLTGELELSVKQMQSPDNPDILAKATDLFDAVLLSDETAIDMELGDIKKEIQNLSSGKLKKKESAYDKKLRRHWKSFLSSVHKKECTDLTLNRTFLNNVFFENAGLYHAVLSYRFKSEGRYYVFSCNALLINDSWKIINFSSIEPEKPVVLY